MRVVLLVCFLSGLCLAEQLHIDAKRVYADDKTGITTAEGNVHILKEQDTLDADKVNIYLNKERKPSKFEAIGNVKFHIFTQDGRELKGKSNTLLYFIESSEYQLIGKAEVQEIGKPNFIKGEKIFLNNESGYTNVESNHEAPVRIIIDLNDVQQDKDSKDSSNTTKETTEPSQNPSND